MENSKEIAKQLRRIADSLKNIENKLPDNSGIEIDGETIRKEIAHYGEHVRANERVTIK